MRYDSDGKPRGRAGEPAAQGAPRMSKEEKRHPNLPPIPKKLGGGRAGFGAVAAKKGMGPNKACGHKGGICRQGSKRG